MLICRLFLGNFETACHKRTASLLGAVLAVVFVLLPQSSLADDPEPLASTTANNQLRHTEPDNPAFAGEAPFEEACSIVERSHRKSESEYLNVCTTRGSAALQYNSVFGNGSAHAKNVLLQLQQKFGEQKTIRGASYVWEIDNPNKSAIQADIVTIILNYNPNGQSELILDRAKGGDGRATWAAPRRSSAVKKNSIAKTDRDLIQEDLRKNEIF